MSQASETLSSMPSPLVEKMGFEMTELSAERAVGSIPVEGNQQPFGLLHGGATAVLVETLASMAAVAHARTMGLVAVGVDLNVTHLNSVTSGRVTGTATPLKLGRRVAVYTVDMHDERGRLTAIGRLTCQLVEPR